MSDAVRVPRTRCPACGNENDATTSTTGAKRAPKQGDYGICVGCGAILEFDAELRCFVPEVQDIAARLMQDEDVARRLLSAQQAVFELNKRRRTHH